mgnify:CR=1 FL=1
MKKKEFVISGSKGKSILVDVTYNENNLSKKVIIFSHGFKGFKDWGAFNKIAEYTLRPESSISFLPSSAFVPRRRTIIGTGILPIFL